MSLEVLYLVIQKSVFLSSSVLLLLCYLLHEVGRGGLLKSSVYFTDPLVNIEATLSFESL